MTPKRAWLAVICLGAAAVVVRFGTAPVRQTKNETHSAIQEATAVKAGAPSAAVAPAQALAAHPTVVTLPDHATVSPPADPITEPHFAAFNQWLERFKAAPPTDRRAMEKEGVALAEQRHAAMFSLIQTDPLRANELAVAPGVRDGLPGAIASLVEHRISARGDYSVLATLALPGREKEVVPIQRTMTMGEKTYRAFVDKSRAGFPTRRQLPFHGVALDDVIAVGDPVRILSRAESKALQVSSAEAICSISGESADSQGDPVAADIGGEVVWTCRYAHTELLRQQQLAAAGTAGGGTVEGVTGESNYTEGRKRIIVFRVAFPNVTTPALSVATGLQLITNINTFLRTMSYGRTTAAMPTEGSDAALVTLTLNSTNYDDDAGRLRTDVRAAATAAGIDLSKYDFDITCVGSTPAYTFAGLGYIGAPGVWLANSYFGVATACHELGHNLGNPHANYWDTSSQSDIGPGGNEEYGDPYDIMGNGGAYAGHYVNKFKYKIGWIPTNDFPRISTSGLYRIYSHDNIDATGLRGLRFRHDGSLDFHVEYRQLYTGNNWMMNGLKVMWGDTNGWTSQLIDTTPGSSDGKNDAPIVIGRTWSDPSANVHLTPIAKGNTYPESLDVMVNFGPFPTNLPPTVQIMASATNIGPGSSVSFSAVAADPNGDALAFYWEFDDGGYTVNNSPTQSHAFSSAGDYVVRCVVSDMKGGRAADTVIVRVGSPATFSISGRVLDRNRPLEGVQVKAGSRVTYTRSDGTYTITRLSAGAYTVSALSYPNTLISPWAPSTVTVGPNASHIDFINLPGGLPTATLVATGAVWKYLDNGTDQGTTWTAGSFDDSSWRSGPAQLGYGDGDEATVVSYGADSNNKYITTYFRRTFNVDDPSQLTNVILRLQRDDGGIVYLNGTEVFRDGMPAGAVNYRTLASTTTDGEWVQASVNRSQLLAGTNTIAVEIHQVLGSSSDISFNLALAGTLTTSTQSYSALYISAPANNTTLLSPASVSVSASAFFANGSFSLLEFYADGVKFGEAATAPYNAIWPSPSLGAHVLTVRGTVAAGGFQTSAPVNITITAPAAPPTVVTYIPQGSTWKYLDNGTDQGAAWIDPGFNDTAWSSGPAQLGYGDTDEATVLCCAAASTKYISYYFRKSFNVVDPTVVTNLAVSLLRDDGGVVYLNGVEVFRSNMPTGPVNYLTLASSAASDDGTTFFSNSISPALLTAGPNVIAVEVHQNAASSSDLSFDLRLTASISSNRAPGVYLISPATGQSYTAPVEIPLRSVAIPPSGRTITQVTFMANNAPVGSATTAPFNVVWSNSLAGVFTVAAIATDSAGISYTSAPVSLTVSAPPRGAELVSPGALWRYLDDGSNQGTNWRSRTFNDSDWAQGYARLGYGGDGEVTTVSFGSDPNKRYLTTYFRRAFTLSSRNFTSLNLLLSKDDGAVVYLNGVEVYRSNMPTNQISFNSLAASTVSGADETNWESAIVSATPLVIGTNIVAVELHQAALNSSDLGFDLQLIGQSATNLAVGVYLAAPAEGAHVTLPDAVHLSAFASGPASIRRISFYRDGALIGASSNAPYAFDWSSAPMGPHSVTAAAEFNDNSAVTSAPVNVVVDGPPLQVSPVLETFIAAGSTWRYWSNGVLPAPNWADLSFDDASWPSAPARFGWGLDGEVTTVPSGRTYYFRRTFACTNPAVISDLIFQLQRDDGAVVYLNGVEMFRSNMPSGLILSDTLSASTVDGLDEQTFFITTLGPSGLLMGTNVVAVEVHQGSTTSSDMGFDLQLNAAGSTAAHVAIGQPVNHQLLVAPADVEVNAYAWAGGTRSVAKVEIFSESGKLGEAASPPYSVTWLSPAIGAHTLTARMTDNFGAVVLSDPVAITVGYQPAALVLIASNSVWKYLDNGSNQGTNWSQSTFNDTAWNSGPARLGYGNDGEETTVSYGPSSTAKYTTTYFRRRFVVPADTFITNLTCKLVRDDGAVVWLNGRELYRSNMPGGTIAYNTLASATASGNDEHTFFATTVATTNVVQGTNILAVEIHQDAGNSSDIGFDLEVDGGGYVFSEVSTQPPMLATSSILAGGGFTLAWPISSGWHLYSSPMLGSGAVWQLVQSGIGTSNGQSVIAVMPTNGAAFFRLQKP